MKIKKVRQPKVQNKKIALDVFGEEIIADSWLNSFKLTLGDTSVNFMNQQNRPDEIKKLLHSISYGGVV